MSTAVTMAAPDTPDTRRITEADADLARIKAATAERLMASLRRLVRDLRAGEHGAASAFIARHSRILRDAYVEAHAEGQRDYWSEVSLTQPKPVPPDPRTMRQRLAFYAPSVAKMAHEAQAAVRASSAARIASEAHTGTLEGVDDALLLDEASDWLAGLDNRVTLQAEVSWVGGQQGYAEGGVSDPAHPYAHLWWDLEPVAQHCAECPIVAAGSPYDPPGSGGNELNQTPGDGRTECGAGCKCSLRYGLSQADAIDWSDWLPPDVVRGTGHTTLTVQLPPSGSWKRTPGGSSGQFSAAEKRVLDQYRAVQAAWDSVRGALPPLPGFFDVSPEPVVPDGVTLSEAQWQVLAAVVGVFAAWQSLQ